MNHSSNFNISSETAPQEKRSRDWRKRWDAEDYRWNDNPNSALLSTKVVLPDASKREDMFPNVSLKEYWRWSLGLNGPLRFLKDEELRELGLLVDVDGAQYHLLHAPDFNLKREPSQGATETLVKMIQARANFLNELRSNRLISIGNHKRNKRTLEVTGALPLRFPSATLQLSGVWVSSELEEVISVLPAVPLTLTTAHFENVFWHVGELGAIDFENGLVSGTADFDGANFAGPAYFSDTIFTDRAVFDRATFESDVDFMGAQFLVEASFDKATFLGSANFASVGFRKRASFWAVEFHKELFAQSAAFDGEADFTQAIFKAPALYESTAFMELANFSKSNFEGKAEFSNTTFKSDAQFSSTTFSGEVDFRQVTFGEAVSFFDVSFLNKANFSFVGWPSDNFPVSFKQAKFISFADFKGSVFTHVEAFNYTKFEQVPELERTTNKEDLLVFKRAMKRAVNFSRKQFKNPQSELTMRQIKIGSWEALASGYRTFKKAASDNLDFSSVQRYYRYELQARTQSPDTAWWEKSAAFFYRLTSDFGTSIARPLVALGVLLLLFTAIYFAFAASVGLVNFADSNSWREVGWECWEFSWNNVFRPLSALSTDAPREGDVSRLAGKLFYHYGGGFSALVRAAATLQSLIGVTTAFLFALAVRRRFQIE